ncbi:MAG TPA: calcium/sodium antiporter [Thermodesulfobacteriaceae bacterium]|nr:calcium/sodium antiporter [Thermodesulfobacteriaceae bacterium]
MIIDFLLLMLGIGLLLGGGDTLVRGASALASGLGISSLVIGLTIVAFGTSAPELAVNVSAAINGNGALSFGNIIGSNIANIGLILGISAMMKPLEIRSIVISREIPMMLVATMAVIIMGTDRILSDTADSYDRSDGMLLLLLFCIFFYYTVGDVLRGRSADPFLQEAGQIPRAASLKSIGFKLILTLTGLTALVCGGKITIESAVNVAHALNIPQVAVGLTMVAIGTSLPELVTSGIATWRGETDLAIGNVVGSNIFNLLLVQGATSVIGPIPMPDAGHLDLAVMAFLSVSLLPLSITCRRKINRTGGIFLVIFYFGYTMFRFVQMNHFI